MGGFTFLDHLFNVCRTLSDVLHICAYLLLVLIAIVVAIYKFDTKMYTKYVYLPILKTFFKKEYQTLLSMPRHGRRSSDRVTTTKWTTSSNRLPYIVKSIRNFINKFNK